MAALIAFMGGMTSRNSSHNAATLNTQVPMTVGPWIRRPRMMATSCKVIVISPTGTLNVCFGPPYLDERGDKLPIDRDVA